jgi:hypothetical protein
MLKSSGDQMATSYFFPDKPPCDEPGLAFLGESAVQHVALTGDAALVAGPVASSYKEAGPYSEHNRTVSAHSGSAQRPVDGGPYETIASAGLALIFASIDDEELRTLAALAEECDRVIDHSIRAPPSIKTNDGTAVPAPLYAKYISVYETRLHDGDLGWLLDDLHGLRDAAHPVPEMLRRIADGESKRDWSERRNIMTYVLRSQLWWAPRIEGKLVTSESLSRAQAELRILLDALIAFHWSYAADKVDLRERMDSWVASVSMTTKVNYYDSLDPNSGFLFARQNEDDLWATIIGSLFRLLPNLGPRGVKRCLHCGWYFHPAMWLKSRTTRVKYCTSFCKMTDGNLRRVK